MKGGISRLTPPHLAAQLHSLPPILHITYPMSMLSCSEGSRGLSVPLRVNGIFTVTTISPSSWLRQYPDRCTIRAGRNLPDKPYTSSLNLAKPCVFDKQSPGSFHCGHHCWWHPFSRSYGVILPSSLAMNHSSTFGFSPRLPVSVYGTGSLYLTLRGFSWKQD